jgi:hypothetical protein
MLPAAVMNLTCSQPDPLCQAECITLLQATMACIWWRCLCAARMLCSAVCPENTLCLRCPIQAHSVLRLVGMCVRGHSQCVAPAKAQTVAALSSSVPTPNAVNQHHAAMSALRFLSSGAFCAPCNRLAAPPGSFSPARCGAAAQSVPRCTAAVAAGCVAGWPGPLLCC